MKDDENIDFFEGIVLQDKSILHTSFSKDNKEKSKLHLKDSVLYISHENENYVGKTYLTKSIPLFIMNYIDEEVVSEWYDNRKKIERKNKKYLSIMVN